MSWRDVAVTSAEQALTNLPKPTIPDEPSPSQESFVSSVSSGRLGPEERNTTDPTESKKEESFVSSVSFGSKDDLFTLFLPIHGQNPTQQEVLPKLTKPHGHPNPPPVQPGWLVAYRDRQGRLSGGCDDRARGTVKVCAWKGGAWTVLLTDGQRLPLDTILSVGKTDGEGRLVSAWSVRGAGYDGETRQAAGS